MSSLNDNGRIERQQFFNGQRLLASDLQELEAFNREMRWLHNRSLHQPGIGNGYAVVGRKGDREVIIRPGYAIDADGREIVLTQTHIEPIPPVAGDEGRPVPYFLTVSYPDDASLEKVETRQGICGSSDVVRLREEPIFCWIRLNDDGQPDNAQSRDDILRNRKIILGRAEVLNCQLNKDLSVAERLNARPSRQPYVCCGRTDKPAWKPWKFAPFDPISFAESEQGKDILKAISGNTILNPYILPIGVEVDIDTSECGFTTPPCYSARIEGPRIRNERFILDGLLQISESRANSFKLNVLLVIQPLIVQQNFELKLASGIKANVAQPKFGEVISAAINSHLKKMADVKAFDDQVGNLLVQFISEKWQIVWLGVEG